MLHTLLEKQLRAAVAAVLPDADTTSILVRPCPDPKFGDYQTNALMSVAKARKMNPRQLATDVVAKLDVSPWCDKVEIDCLVTLRSMRPLWAEKNMTESVGVAPAVSPWFLWLCNEMEKN